MAHETKGYIVVKHEEIWAAIDKLAEVNGLSPCGLARAAGLDLTSFNPSKRFARGNHMRWPTFETINKILDATNTTLAEFVEMIPENPGPIQRGRRRRK